jgi:hypothetical protein
MAIPSPVGSPGRRGAEMSEASPACMRQEGLADRSRSKTRERREARALLGQQQRIANQMVGDSSRDRSRGSSREIAFTHAGRW